MISSSEASAPKVDVSSAQALPGWSLQGCAEVAQQAEQQEVRQQTINELSGVLTRQLVKQLTAIAAKTGLCRAIVDEATDRDRTDRDKTNREVTGGHSLSGLLESLESLSGAMIETTRRVRDLAAEDQPGRRAVALTAVWNDLILVASERLKLTGRQFRVKLDEFSGKARVDVVELMQALLRGTAAVLAELPDDATIHFNGHRFSDRYAMLLSDAASSHASTHEVRAWLDDSWVETSALANDFARLGFATLQPRWRLREFKCFVIWVPLT
ncbi:hypothetical protein SH139x_004341 [Planctomycetaceae bacterium SH139]